MPWRASTLGELRGKQKATSRQTGAREVKMDKSADWPWNTEEEVEWKTELEEKEERSDELLEELIDSAADSGIAGSRIVPGPPQKEEPAEDGVPEKYSVTT